jgi:hypothetical protein
MINAINPDEPVEYIIKSDRKADKPTIWYFRNLSFKQAQQLERHILSFNKIKNKEERIYESISYCLNLCLLEPKNFKYSKGKSAAFIRNNKKADIFPGIKPWTDKTLQQIPYIYLFEFYNFILSKYTEPDEKTLKN